MDRPKRRRLLVASVGIASVSYALAACGKNQPISGNLPAPDPTETTPISGNLPAPPPPVDAEAPEAATTTATDDAAAPAADAGKVAPKK